MASTAALLATYAVRPVPRRERGDRRGRERHDAPAAVGRDAPGGLPAHQELAARVPREGGIEVLDGGVG